MMCAGCCEPPWLLLLTEQADPGPRISSDARVLRGELVAHHACTAIGVVMSAVLDSVQDIARLGVVAQV